MIIEDLGADAIVACSTDLLPGVAAVVKREEFGFVRLPYLHINRPKGSPKDLSAKAPSPRKARALWFSVEEVPIESSEAENLDPSALLGRVQHGSESHADIQAGLRGV